MNRKLFFPVVRALEAFRLLRAPFDGIVTARDVDIGAYVANGSDHELFRVARTSPLRIYVNVPQRDAQLVKIGMEGDLTLPQFPNRTFRAHVTNTAEVVHPTFRREGPAVGVVHPDGKVELRKITINRDFGDKLEISQGLSTSDQVILNPSDSLTAGIASGLQSQALFKHLLPDGPG